MDTEIDRLDLSGSQKPRVYVNDITYNDGTVNSYTHSSIVVFTGANNSGKSQVLRDIELKIKDSSSPSIIVSKLTTDCIGEFDDGYVVSKFKLGDDGNYWLGGNGNYPHLWKLQWDNRKRSLIGCMYLETQVWDNL